MLRFIIAMLAAASLVACASVGEPTMRSPSELAEGRLQRAKAARAPISTRVLAASEAQRREGIATVFDGD